MKKNLLVLLISLFFVDIGYSQYIVGDYNTDYGTMTLTQDGNIIYGTYEGGNGKLKGRLNGTQLVGTWSNSSSNKSGNFEFIFATDFLSFTGKYGYNNNVPDKKWNGKKIIPTNTPVDPPSPTIVASIAGDYNTDYGTLTLTQDGNIIYGTYEGGNGKLKGRLNGTQLVGTWSNSSSNKSGNFEFIFTTDFLSFTGKYGYNNNVPDKKWNGKKIIPTNTAVDPPPPTIVARITGDYSTDYRTMTLTQDGNIIYGTYEDGNGKLKGTLNEAKLIGTWTNVSSQKSGTFLFDFTPDYSSFKGKYGYNNSAPSKKWNGTKIK